MRVARSNSVTTATFALVHAIDWKRCSNRSHSSGWPSNGACSTQSRSRWGAAFRRSPPSSASAQASVAGSIGFHVKSRGPSGTPATGTVSFDGRSAITRTSLPALDHTSAVRAKPEYGSSRENGRFSRTTNT